MIKLKYETDLTCCISSHSFQAEDIIFLHPNDYLNVQRQKAASKMSSAEEETFPDVSSSSNHRSKMASPGDDSSFRQKRTKFRKTKTKRSSRNKIFRLLLGVSAVILSHFVGLSLAASGSGDFNDSSDELVMRYDGEVNIGEFF